MKFFIIFGLITGAVWAAKSETTTTKTKRVISTSADRIDTSARKVIRKGRSAWENRNVDKEMPKEAQEEK